MNLQKVSLEVIEKWLQKETENGQKVIEILFDITEFEFNFNPSDFKKIDPSVTDNRYRITEALNEYFIEINYPFEAHCNPYEVYIKKTKSLFCGKHGKILTTESDLKKHRGCLKNHFVLRTERKEYPENIFIEAEERATIEKQKKKIEEERKAIRDR